MRHLFALSLVAVIGLSFGAAEAEVSPRKSWNRRASPMLISPQTPSVTTAATAAVSYSAPVAGGVTGIGKSQAYAAYRPILSPYKLHGGLPGIRSDGGRLTVGYRFAEAEDDGLRRPLNPKERQVTQQVLQQLSSLIPVRFVESPIGYLQLTAADLSAANIGGFTNLPEPHSAGQTGGQVVLDRNLCDAADPQDQCIRFRRVLRHELGHALGLQHPWEAGETYEKMQSIMSYEPYEDYQPADVAALQHLYGNAPGSTMVADAQALTLERAQSQHLWTELKANPALALKAALTQHEPPQPPTPSKGSFVISSEEVADAEENATQSVIGAVLDRIFGAN